MKTVTYRPSPFDTSEVALSDDLLQLAEQIARMWGCDVIS